MAGIDPVKSLSPRPKATKLLRLPISLGITPLIWQPVASRNCREADRFPMEFGITPCSLFEFILNCLRDLQFVSENGKQFEAVLAEQDSAHGRFPFLLPFNQYHPYYLKALQNAQGYQGLIYSGIDPVKSLSPRAKLTKLLRLPISRGIMPLIWQPVASSNSREVGRFPTLVQKSHFSRQMALQTVVANIQENKGCEVANFLWNGIRKTHVRKIDVWRRTECTAAIDPRRYSESRVIATWTSDASHDVVPTPLPEPPLTTGQSTPLRYSGASANPKDPSEPSSVLTGKERIRRQINGS
ncbi:hypothetical protein RJ640_002903 [Escallonia rubra]|uniref:SURP motif domain-containing protein n=1 Tax=Escallonia rubra TaxID=112253 RepID=A0AA88RTY5_9ASTE|nr:hypothetical protein RJ640_002903 [Escallonia rubra]